MVDAEPSAQRFRPPLRSALAFSLPVLVWLAAAFPLFAALAWWVPEPARDLVGQVAWIRVWLGLGLVCFGLKLSEEIVRWAARAYVLSPARVAATHGVLHRVTAMIPLSDVRQVVVDRPLMLRVLGLGTVRTSSAGSQVMDVAWVGVDRAEGRAEEIRVAARFAAAATAPRLMIIGLAGGIGAGKSEVARALERRGYLVVDSDKDAKAALDLPRVREQLRGWWGERVIGADGRVDRKVVAEIVFGEPAERARLEALVHPIVRADRATLLERARSGGRPGVVLDAPLLFEAGFDGVCDAVIFVDAPLEMRVERVRRTRGWTEEELLRREKAQLPLEEKRRRSDVIVSNERDAAAVEAQVGRALAALAARPSRLEGQGTVSPAGE